MSWSLINIIIIQLHDKLQIPIKILKNIQKCSVFYNYVSITLIFTANINNLGDTFLT